MSFARIPSTSSTNISASTAPNTGPSNLLTGSGLSSLGSSISSSGNKQSKETCRDFFSCVLSPFKVIGKFFTNRFSKITNFFKDAAIRAFIKKNLRSLDSNPNIRAEAIDKFSSISNEKNKLEAIFPMLYLKHYVPGNPGRLYPDVSAETVKAFYDLLPKEVQNHIEEHIWLANGGNDNGEGIQFGRNVINRDIKSTLVMLAVSDCIAECDAKS